LRSINSSGAVIIFKNLSIFSVSLGLRSRQEDLRNALLSRPFVECAPSQEKSMGWVTPRGHDYGGFMESVGGQWILRFVIETKSVPATAIARQAKERAEAIEKAEGRKPGQKEMKEIKEQVRFSLLPQSFSKQLSIWVWIDPVLGRLVIDTSSDARADEVVTLLNRTLDGIKIERVRTLMHPRSCMSLWLTDEAPARFTVDRETELKELDDIQATVRYSKHTLDIDEVRSHIESGKMPTRLAMTYNDRISFVLTEKMHVKKINFLDGVFDTDRTQDKDEQFDGDMTITTAELSAFIPDLVDALGGLDTSDEVGSEVANE
jgi:recombination associated protein RdgC